MSKSANTCRGAASVCLSAAAADGDADGDRIIYDYAKVPPSYPDTGPQPTVRELFTSRDRRDTLNPRYTELVLGHYDQVLPGVEF